MHFPKFSILLLSVLITRSVFSPCSVLAEQTKPAAIEESRSVEERRILVSLEEERTKVKEQQKILAAKEMELKTLQAEVDNQLNELGRIRTEIQKDKKELQELIEEKEAKESTKIRQLGKVYEKMDPAKAASIIATLDKKLAVDILANMKQKSAGKILNNLDASEAATLSVVFSSLDARNE